MFVLRDGFAAVVVVYAFVAGKVVMVGLCPVVNGMLGLSRLSGLNCGYIGMSYWVVPQRAREKEMKRTL